jgi:hypothetical protein
MHAADKRVAGLDHRRKTDPFRKAGKREFVVDSKKEISFRM